MKKKKKKEEKEEKNSFHQIERSKLIFS